jgi:hypothetical protein
VQQHHQALLATYAVALLGWLGIARACPALWPCRSAPAFPHPWQEVGWALLAVVSVLALGQAYLHGYRLRVQGSLAPLGDALNQVAIFSPLFLLLALRQQKLATAWLPTDRVGLRLLVGTGLAWLSLLAFTLVRSGSNSWGAMVACVYSPTHLAFAVQVFCEDVAIAILFTRFQAALGARLSIVLVGLLFAGAHLPTLLTEGAPGSEMLRLLFDGALGVLVLSVVRRSQDVWWFWCVHFALDMTQFCAVP